MSRLGIRWSVVLPYYNETGYLRPTLESLFAQAFRDFRLILVDNASTDGSDDLARQIAAEHADIETLHFHESRPGKINALQCGLAAVETEFVAFCDADTFYPRHYLRRANELFASSDAVAVMAMDLPADHESPAARRKRAKVMMVSRILSRQTHTGGFGQSFRTETLRKAGGFSAELWPFVLEDHEVMQRVFKFGRSVYAPDLWCIPSNRRKDRTGVGWTTAEQLLYHLTPFAMKDWFFYRFLARRFAARALDNTKLRQKSWDQGRAEGTKPSPVGAQIRQAKEEDAASVVAWFTTHAEVVLWGGPAVPANFDAKWFAREIAAAPDNYRVACAPNGAIVGVCGLRPFTQENRLHIQRLGVAPHCRSNGLGRLLIRDAIAVAQKQGAQTISLNVYGSNVRARRLYEQFGFRALSTRDAPEDASGISVYMERPAAL